MYTVSESSVEDFFNSEDRMITDEVFGTIQGTERYPGIVWKNVSCCEYHKMIFYNTKIGVAKTQQLYNCRVLPILGRNDIDQFGF